jgi:TolA-binding protein
MRSPQLGYSLLGVAILVATAGCYSKSAGERLAREAADRERRIVSLEEGMSAERAAMETKMAELERVLEQATSVVTRNSADIGTEVQRLREQIQVLEGEIAELRNELTSTQRALSEQQQEIDRRIQQFARKAGVDMPVDASQIPADPAEHFAAAQRAQQANDHSTARALFREYVTRYRDDARADDAQYAIGKTYLVEGRPASALAEFRKVIAEFRTGDVVDRALFDMAEAFYALHACTDARSALEALISAHPRSPLVAQARTKLRDIQRAPRGYCTS